MNGTPKADETEVTEETAPATAETLETTAAESAPETKGEAAE